MSGDFGIRSIPPCRDCDPADGHCTMNCGPVGPAPAAKVSPETIARLDHLHEAGTVHGRDDHRPDRNKRRTQARYQFAALLRKEWPAISKALREGAP
jgi:hypothetical protein